MLLDKIANLSAEREIAEKVETNSFLAQQGLVRGWGQGQGNILKYSFVIFLGAKAPLEIALVRACVCACVHPSVCP